MTARHHSVHPVSSVKPNLDINKKPNYTPPEKAAANVNPSLPGAVGVDAANARVPASKVLGRDDDNGSDGFDEDSLNVS